MWQPKDVDNLGRLGGFHRRCDPVNGTGRWSLFQTYVLVPLAHIITQSPILAIAVIPAAPVPILDHQTAGQA